MWPKLPAINSHVHICRCVHTTILMLYRTQRCPGLVIAIMLSVVGLLIIRNVELFSSVSVPSRLQPSSRMVGQVVWTTDLRKMVEPVISQQSSSEPVISQQSSSEPVIPQEAPEVLEPVMSGEKAFDASSVDAVTKLTGPVPWKEWSDRLPKVSYEDLEWRQPLGRVPFYMYDDEEWDDMMRVKFQCASTPKVCPEFMFLHQLRFHPWRVNDIEKAAVVVLPIITSDLSTHGRNTGLENQMEIQTRFAQIRKMIDPSKRHVLLIADWVIRHLMQQLKWKPVSDFVVVSQALFRPWQAAPIANPIFSSVLGTMSADVMKNLEAFPSPTATTIDNFRKRKHLFNFLGQADSRRAYYLRTLILKLFSKVREPSVLTLVRVPGTRQRIILPACDLKGLDETDWKGCHVEQGQLSIDAQDYLMQTSKFVLITRGDNGGSQRIQQA
ncbi:MAG: uncharacterized protein KVP18_003855, partial [Porospora cf. gigantea A]|uniref:uncharacterized protein n=1 Tax=Porospora cf. gigantea A TaxID=2853593 RepID=UPI00355A6777